MGSLNAALHFSASRTESAPASGCLTRITNSSPPKRASDTCAGSPSGSCSDSVSLPATVRNTASPAVTEGIVDPLEAVEIEIHDRNGLSHARSLRELPLGGLQTALPVGETREWIEIG